MPIDVTTELLLCQTGESERSAMDSWWQSIKDVCVPKDAYITRQRGGSPTQDYDRIHDTTIVESAEGLANMMTAQLTPAGEQWLAYKPTYDFTNDEQVVEWYAECSARVLHLLNQSNFQIVQSDLNTERATVGTGMFMAYETGNKYAPFRFKYAHVGTYTFEEDLDGRADEIRRKFEATAAQLMREFPDAAFGAKVLNAYADQTKRHTQKFTIWHVVKPRVERDKTKMENTNMPYAEFYICVEDRNVINEGGQHEFCAVVSRFQSGMDGSKWGISPAYKAMPAAAQVNFLQEQLDVLLDIQINPRVIAEAGMVGEIDMRAGQKTLVRAGGMSGSGGVGVREWLTGGNYPLGKDRIADKQSQIRKLFYHGLWADLARVEKEMTAEEVRAIRDQSEMLFVGVNARFESDMKPILARRLFGICLRAGVFPPIPPQLAKASSDGWDIPDPEVTFQTNLSRVLQRKAVENSDMFLTRLEKIAQYNPDILDEFDLAVHARELCRAFGFKAPFMRSEQDVAEIITKRIEAQQQAMQQQQATQMAETAAKFSPAIQSKMTEQAMSQQPQM
jgi:hypothetical protein